MPLGTASDSAQREEQRPKEQRSHPDTHSTHLGGDWCCSDQWTLGTNLGVKQIKENHRDTEGDSEMDKNSEKGEWEGGRNPERNSGEQR